MSKRPIVITAGDPAGIGYDILAKIWQQGYLQDTVIIADPKVLAARALSIGAILDNDKSPEIIALNFNDDVIAGIGQARNATEIIRSLDIAIDGCLDGTFSAMVTAPLNKGIINDGGIPFSGHTEYLAERTKALLPVMMLANDQLKVVLVTTHIPLKDVANTISRDLISTIVSTTHFALQKYWKLNDPKIAVLGLNPHAGENGHIGMEDQEILVPCINNLIADGLNITGPMPACTAFIEENVQRYDTFIAMYHDQGLPVIKAKGFGETVNITLGLPIIRTSVDHGTAYDIAATGLANELSLISAIKTAKSMSANK